MLVAYNGGLYASGSITYMSKTIEKSMSSIERQGTY